MGGGFELIVIVVDEMMKHKFTSARGRMRPRLVLLKVVLKVHDERQTVRHHYLVSRPTGSDDDWIEQNYTDVTCRAPVPQSKANLPTRVRQNPYAHHALCQA